MTRFQQEIPTKSTSASQTRGKFERETFFIPLRDRKIIRLVILAGCSLVYYTGACCYFFVFLFCHLSFLSLSLTFSFILPSSIPHFLSSFLIYLSLPSSLPFSFSPFLPPSFLPLFILYLFLSLFIFSLSFPLPSLFYFFISSCFPYSFLPRFSPTQASRPPGT